MYKKTALWAGLIEHKTAIDYLAIKLHVGNKRSKGELTSATNMHEDVSEDDSRLPRRFKRKRGKFKCWKAG